MGSSLVFVIDDQDSGDNRMYAVRKLAWLDHALPTMSRQGQLVIAPVSADLAGSATPVPSAAVARMGSAHASRVYRQIDTVACVLPAGRAVVAATAASLGGAS